MFFKKSNPIPQTGAKLPSKVEINHSTLDFFFSSSIFLLVLFRKTNFNVKPISIDEAQSFNMEMKLGEAQGVSTHGAPPKLQAFKKKTKQKFWY